MIAEKSERLFGRGLSFNATLKIGFGAVLVLLAAVTAIGLARMASINQRVEQVVGENNVKIDLAHRMKDATRDRAIMMHSIAVLTDPFDQQDELERFNSRGGVFASARTQLTQMKLGAQEEEILGRMREITLKTQPLVVQAIDTAVNGSSAEAQALIATGIVPLQKELASSIEELIELQKRETEAAVRDVAQTYASARLLMLLFGGSATILGIGIAVAVARNVGEQARLLQMQATFDSLTQLPNRVLFDERLRQAILTGRREKWAFALMAMDLDRFKEINDTLGHHAGDQVLQHVAACVRACLRESDTVARMGGDEFAILLATARDPDGAAIVANKILQALSEPFEAAGRSLEIGASLGVAVFPQHGEDPASLLRNADAAMYAAKQSHGGYRVYSEDLGHGADDRLALQGELRRAIAGDELVLHYQPKIDFGAERVGGVEALVRWQHPRHGLMLPDKFIPLAEQYGLIKPLTRWVLRAALRQCEQWQQAGLALSISVNISAVSIQDAEFPGEVARLLREFAVAPERLELELTETAVMSEPARATDCIRRLSALGLQIAIDDFGTGYSSMAYLKDLLVAKIKIDKSFVKDMAVSHRDSVIVSSTVALGHNLGLKVVAEGVEDRAAWDRLKELGCDSAQGYYMSRPLPAAEFLDWLQNSQWGERGPNVHGPVGSRAPG